MKEKLIYIFCFNSLIILFLNIFAVKADIYSVSVSYLLLGIFVFFIGKNKLKKNINITKNFLNIKRKNFFSYVIIFLLTVFIFYKMYSWKIYVNYASTDPANHVAMVRDFFYSGTIFFKNPVYNAQGYPFFAYVNTALVYNFFQFISLYKFFIIMNSFIFLISAFLFYDILEMMTSKKSLSLIGTLFFMFGFYLSNFIFGFTPQYYSMTIILVLFKDLYKYLNNIKNLKKLDCIFLFKLVLLLIGIQNAYYYYTPQLLFSIFIILFLNKEKKELKYGILAYLIFFVSYNFYTYLKIGYEGLIATEGFVYRDLYNSFLFFIPLGIYFLLNRIKIKKYDLLFSMFVGSLLFTSALFVLGMKGKVSGYYFYKNYAYLSVFLILSAFEALNEIGKKDRVLLKSVILFYLISVIFFFKLDEYIAKKNPSFNVEIGSKRNSVYLDNFTYLLNKTYIFNEEEMRLINYISENKKYVIKFDDSNRLPIVSDNRQFTWFKEITGIWPSMDARKKYYFEILKLEDFEKNNKFEYLVIFPRRIPQWMEENRENLKKYDIDYIDGENMIVRKRRI